MSFWHSLPQPIIGLSPMDGVTDAAFRFVVAKQGRADVSFTEFTSVGDICRGPGFLLSSLLYSEGERPVVAQLYGKDPDLFYQAAHVVCELGFDGLDINMGCPSRNVASSGSGAGLIKTPERAHAIMRAARRGIEDWAAGQTLDGAGLKLGRAELISAMNLRRSGQCRPARRLIPLSVKTRLGYDSVVIDSWLGHLLEERPAAVSVHGRTLEQMYRGEADWPAIERVAQMVQGTGTLLLGNGDLQSMRDVVRRVRDSAVHGVLVGRGTLGRPWFFATKDLARSMARAAGPSEGEAVLDGERHLLDRFAVMIGHARRFEATFGVDRFPRMRKHLGWYCKGFAHAAAMRADMVRTRSASDVERLLDAYTAGQSSIDHTPDPDQVRPLMSPLSCN